MKILAIVGNTFREGLARKTIIAFFVISTLVLLVVLLGAIFVSTVQMMPGGQGQPGNPMASITTVPQFVELIEAGMTGFIHFIALLLAVFATASIIPNALEKGAIDLLLSKPVSRTNILHGMFLGSGAIALANVAYFIVGLWLIISVKTGYWNWNFLAVIPIVTFSFLVLYTPMMVLGISTRSSALSIIIVYIFLYVISPVLHSRELALFKLIGSDTVRGIVSFFYYTLPKPNDIGTIAAQAVQHQGIDWMPLWSSALFAAGMYGLAVFLFRKKDF
jgi:ABC-type transport system involved in multi-copper enzyme maturation permease subunit